MEQIEKGITIVITQNCNLKCKYCLRDNSYRINESFDIIELRKILDTIQKHGYTTILTTGGEPFLVPHIVEYLEYLTAAGMKTLVESNGTLIDKNILGKIVTIKNYTKIHFLISLDHYLPEIHDYMRGKGSFQQAIKCIRLLTNHGFYIHTNRVFTPNTLIHDTDDLLKYLYLCEELKVNEVHFSKVVYTENKHKKYALTKDQIVQIREIISNATHRLLDLNDCETLWRYATKKYCPKIDRGAISISKNGISPCNLIPDIILDSYENLENYLTSPKEYKFSSLRKKALQSWDEKYINCTDCGLLCRNLYRSDV